MSEMVRLDRLTRRFGPLLAVDGVSLGLGRGEVLGFLGPNGAGKSTTMRMLTGFIPPSSGSATVQGFDVVRQPIEAKRRIGYLPEGAPLYGDMTVLAFLDFIARMRGLGGSEAARRIAAAVERTSLAEVGYRPIETLSKGFKRRVGLAQAILHDPPVLVLDEPTDGLDPNQKLEVRHLIQTMATDKAIIISTHILEEVDAICTRAVVIAKGRIVADGTPGELRRRAPDHNAVRVRVPAAMLVASAGALTGLSGIQRVEQVATVDGSGALVVTPEAGRPIASEISARLAEAGVPVEELTVEPGRLEEVFRLLTTGTGAETAARTH